MILRTPPHTCGTFDKMPPRPSKTWGWISTKQISWLTEVSPCIHSSSALKAGVREVVEVQCWIVLAGDTRDRSQAGSRAWESQDQRNLERKNWTAANISLGNSPLPKTAWLSDCIWGTWLVFTSPEHYLSDCFILFSSHARLLSGAGAAYRDMEGEQNLLLSSGQAGNKVQRVFLRFWKIST